MLVCAGKHFKPYENIIVRPFPRAARGREVAAGGWCWWWPLMAVRCGLRFRQYTLNAVPASDCDTL